MVLDTIFVCNSVMLFRVFKCFLLLPKDGATTIHTNNALHIKIISCVTLNFRYDDYTVALCCEKTAYKPTWICCYDLLDWYWHRDTNIIWKSLAGRSRQVCLAINMNNPFLAFQTEGARLYFLKLKFDQAQSYFIILPITCVLKYSLGSFAVLRDCQHLPNIF